MWTHSYYVPMPLTFFFLQPTGECSLPLDLYVFWCRCCNGGQGKPSLRWPWYDGKTSVGNSWRAHCQVLSKHQQWQRRWILVNNCIDVYYILCLLRLTYLCLFTCTVGMPQTWKSVGTKKHWKHVHLLATQIKWSTNKCCWTMASATAVQRHPRWDVHGFIFYATAQKFIVQTHDRFPTTRTNSTVLPAPRATK